MDNFRGKIYKTLHLIIPYHMEMALIYGGLNISYTFGLEFTTIRVRPNVQILLNPHK